MRPGDESEVSHDQNYRSGKKSVGVGGNKGHCTYHYFVFVLLFFFSFFFFSLANVWSGKCPFAPKGATPRLILQPKTDFVRFRGTFFFSWTFRFYYQNLYFLIFYYLMKNESNDVHNAAVMKTLASLGDIIGFQHESQL